MQQILYEIESKKTENAFVDRIVTIIVLFRFSLVTFRFKKSVLFKFSRVFETASKEPIDKGIVPLISDGFSPYDLYSTRRYVRHLLTGKYSKAKKH